MELVIDIKTEQELLSVLLQNSKKVDISLLNKIEPEYFTIDSYKWAIKTLKERDWKSIHRDFIDQELLTVEDLQKRDEYRNQLLLLYNKEPAFAEDAINKYKTYISYCIASAKIRESFEGFNRTSQIDLMLNEIHHGIASAKDVISGGTLRATDYAENYWDRQERRKARRDNPSISPRFLFGIKDLDSQFTIRPPIVIDFLAPFKRYKSIFLCDIGFAGLLQGLNVVHISYENSKELTFERYDSLFSGINFNRICNMLLTNDEKTSVDELFYWINNWGNRLKVIKAKSRETTVKDIENELDRLRDEEGFVPDVEVWDYLNIIKPSESHREERIEQGTITWDLVTHAEKYNTVIIEASQANMQGAVADRLSMDHRGKAIDISQGVFLSIAIDQNEQEKKEGIIVLSPMFVRSGKITKPEIVLDADIAKMCVAKELHKLWGVAQEVNPYKPSPQRLQRILDNQ